MTMRKRLYPVTYISRRHITEEWNPLHLLHSTPDVCGWPKRIPAM